MQRKISVIFILPDLEMGGAERIVTTIANHLPREEFVPKILLLRKEGAYLDILKKDVEIIHIQTERIRHSLRPIVKEICRRKPDIVFSGFGEVNAYLSVLIKVFPKIKFVARETNIVSQHVQRKEIRFFYKFYNTYHKIIAQSEDMRTDLLQQFKIRPEKLVKINNPVDFDFIDARLFAACRPPEFLPHYKNVVAIGNLTHRKGFDLLLKVFVHLKDKNILLHILGDGKDAQMLHEMKEMLDLQHVIFHGKQENPYQFLKFADLFVLSSRYEGFPNVLLEAGACGTFSLTNTCLGGISEIIQSGINGEMADIEDSKAFANFLVQILNHTHDPRSIRNSIRSRFSKENIMKQYIHLFHSLFT